MFVKPNVTKTFIERWDKNGAWQTVQRQTYTFVNDSQKIPETNEPRDNAKHCLQDQRAKRFVDEGQTNTFVNETQEDDENRRDRVYSETTGGRDTHRISHPAGEQQAYTFVKDLRGPRIETKQTLMKNQWTRDNRIRSSMIREETTESVVLQAIARRQVVETPAMYKLQAQQEKDKRIRSLKGSTQIQKQRQEVATYFIVCRCNRRTCASKGRRGNRAR
ncbi:hypothetical protein L208DRAFT_1381635 [Tricholoma matsutake]|nr:hypothetical protein L208DRAFT_1381635 [Tricholoma matsutake 945]